jgi:hypothetical protein
MKKAEIITHLESDKGDTDYVLRTSNEDKTFLENYKTSVIEAEFDPQTSKIYKGIDDDIFSVIGERKKPTEKTYDFLKSKLSELKTRAEKVAELESEITILKQSKPDDAKLQEIRDLQNQIKKIKTQHDEELTAFSQRTQKSLIKSDIERGLMDLKIKTGIPETVKQVYVNQIIDELANSAEMRDGQLVFLDADKKALRNPATMAPYTAKELLTEKMKDLIEVGHKQEGLKLPADTPPVSKGKDGKLTLNFVRPADVSSRQKLGEHLLELGLKRGSPEFNEAYKTYGADLPAFEPKSQ